MPTDFYREANRHICQAAFELKDNFNLVSCSEFLTKHNLLEASGGIEYLEHILEATITSAAVEFHAKTVKNYSLRRYIIKACSLAAESASELTVEPAEALSNLKIAIKDIESEQQADFEGNKALMNAVFKDTEERAKSGKKYIGVKTGFWNIDEHILGLEPKTTYYLIARPSMGKTALALNIAENVSQEGKVLFFSLESNRLALMRRRWAAHSKVYLTRIRTGNIEDSQWPDLIESADVLSKSNLVIIDRPRYKTVENLTALSQSLAIDYSLSLIVIDHIQRMRTRKKVQNRHLELSYISEEISSLANELNVPILVLSQLSRDIEKQKNPRPRLTSIKESGDLEANADSVWGLYRKDKEAEIAELEGLKGRDTGIWKATLKFDRYIQKFYDSEDHYEVPGEKVSRGFDG